jgi:hypothetical protein
MRKTPDKIAKYIEKLYLQNKYSANDMVGLIYSKYQYRIARSSVSKIICQIKELMAVVKQEHQDRVNEVKQEIVTSADDSRLNDIRRILDLATKCSINAMVMNQKLLRRLNDKLDQSGGITQSEVAPLYTIAHTLEKASNIFKNYAINFGIDLTEEAKQAISKNKRNNKLLLNIVNPNGDIVEVDVMQHRNKDKNK